MTEESTLFVDGDVFGQGLSGRVDRISRRMLVLLLTLVGCRVAKVPPDLGRDPLLHHPLDGLCVSETLDHWDPDHRESQIQPLAESGVHWIRQDLRWALVEPERGVWTWDVEDAVVDAAEQAGVGIIAMLGYGVPWASDVVGADEFYPPADPADFADFAAAVAHRYGNRIGRYEIWNEPNSGFRFWKGGEGLSGDPVAYAALAARAVAAIHDERPNAEVEVGSVFWHEQFIEGGPAFLADAWAADAARPAGDPSLADADVLSFHPYTQYPPQSPPEDGRAPEQSVESMVQGMEDVADGRPLSVTEFGWPSWLEVDEQTQADWTIRELALLHAEGIDTTCVYTLEDSEDAANPESDFGLYRLGLGELKPVGEAVQALSYLDLASVIGEAASDLGLPEEARAVRYLNSDGAPITILWTTGDPVDVVVPHPEGLDPCFVAPHAEVDSTRQGVALRLTGTPVVLEQGTCTPPRP